MMTFAAGGWRHAPAAEAMCTCLPAAVGCLRVTLAVLMLCAWSLSPPLGAAEPESPDRTSPQAFEQHFKQAFTSGERGKALALFYWRGVPEATREGVKLLVARDLAATLLRTGWLPAESSREFWSGDVRMRSNLTVVARFAAQFEVEGGGRHVSMHEVGVVDGIFYIGLAEPVPNARAVNLQFPSSTHLR